MKTFHIQPGCDEMMHSSTTVELTADHEQQPRGVQLSPPIRSGRPSGESTHGLAADVGTCLRIVGRRNGVGLDRDIKLIMEALSGIPACDKNHIRSLKPLTEALWGGDDSVVNILVERIPLTWLFARGKSVLIPNQERFPKRHIWRLRGIDTVFCKSHHAEQIFRQLGAKTRYIGFTSVDRKLSDTTPDYGKFLHLAGRSTLKGTDAILRLWNQHPEWPTLTLIQHPDNAPNQVPRNVNLVAEYLDDQELQMIQNEHGIHLCPSAAEGWGHYIVEAMSCNAVVITTDGPPMNELVDNSRGILVRCSESSPRHLGTEFRIVDASLESAIQSTIDMQNTDLQRMGSEARTWFKRNDHEFRARIIAAMDQLQA